MDGKAKNPSIGKQLLCTGCGLGHCHCALVHAKRSLAPLLLKKTRWFWHISPPRCPLGPDAPRCPRCPSDAPQMPPRFPPDASQMPPRCPPDASLMPPGTRCPQMSQMPLRCLPDAPQMSPRCLPDASQQMPLRCLPPRCSRKHCLGSRAGVIFPSILVFDCGFLFFGGRSPIPQYPHPTSIRGGLWPPPQR